MPSYFSPSRAGARHGASGRDPAPPTPTVSDRVSDALFDTDKVAQVEKEADQYHQAYNSAALNRIANNK